MAAVVDPVDRAIYLTGAIDVNDTRINMEIELPDAGEWRLIKAETNLTNESWTSWLITLGKGMSLQHKKSARLFSRQFKKSIRSDTGSSFLFYGGSVRPGEPVLKIMDFVTETKAAHASHSRIANPEDDVLGTLAYTTEQATEYMHRTIEAASKKPIVDVRAAVTVLDPIDATGIRGSLSKALEFS